MISTYGNIIESNAKVIAHGCNRRGVMGAGVAKVIRTAYPECFKPYLDACVRKEPLGSIIPVKCRNGRWIVNILSQNAYGKRGTGVFATPQAILDGLNNTFNWMRDNELDTIALPEIGASLGGLTRDDFYNTLEAADSSGIEVEVRYLNLRAKVQAIKNKYGR